MAQTPPDASADHGNELISWHIPEFEKHNRSLLWYVVAVLVGIGLIVWALFTQNYLFIVIMLLVAIILIRQASMHPAHLAVTLFEDGVQVGVDSFYDYKDIKNFWIIYEPPKVKKLYFTFKMGIRPDLMIPLGSQNPLLIRQTLRQYLGEDLTREGEPTSEALGRILKI